MKRVIVASEDFYEPEPFDDESSKVLLNKVKGAVIDKYGRRLKGIRIEMVSPSYTDTSVSAQFNVYNKNTLKASKLFEFHMYDDYWEESDYIQHLNMCINKFLEDLL